MEKKHLGHILEQILCFILKLKNEVMIEYDNGSPLWCDGEETDLQD